MMKQHTGGTVALCDVYEQAKRIKAFSAGQTGEANGVCEGQCLHWLRRVLQGGKPGYAIGKTNKDGSERTRDQLLAKMKAQHAGGVVAARMLDDDVRRAISERMKGQLDTRLRERMSADKMSFDDAQAARSKILNQDFYKTSWNTLAQILDTKLHGTAAGHKRNFRGIVCTSAKIRGQMSIADLVAALQNQGLFQAGRGALITGGVSGGAHAFAVHVCKLDELYLFDPNYGVFKCSNPTSLNRAIVTLISKIWVTLEKWQLDNEYGYAVFEAKDELVAIQPGQHEVAVLHGDRATFLANKASLKLY
jgi:hypothetical protein